ncbi:TPA: hypothetical protein MXV08_004061 [Pseudomonas aeruginosa]|nr:hypothetical protein [Pseudomonas aeruginosa]HCA6578203.1 hypothetical protein [Pseudomonas aeruginosa]HCA6932489.1 hypothetical protein [Pseudomonas aeruginosa]HCA7561307.1 hypothetical protein [Pseudomonas aeruginosa]HCA7573163.1 hypothetical protein [Pseudomonas aeruginosa]
MRTPLAIAVALLLSGCGTALTNPQEVAEGQQALQACLSATEIAAMRSTCFRRVIDQAGEKAAAQAEAHWNDAVARMQPDERLLASILWPNLNAVKAAIASGANVNREFTNRVVAGTNATDPQGMRSVLDIAVDAFEPEIAELLLLEGANPNWRASEDDLDMFTSRIMQTQSYTDRDGNVKTITGMDMAELGVKYGLAPTAESLLRLEVYIQTYRPGIYSTPDMKPFYDALMQRITPEVTQRLVSLKEKQRQADEQRAKEEQKRNDERLQSEARRRLVSEQATKALNERKRVIGTRICKEAPSQFGTLIYIGYVEGLAPEKVQIRVSNAVYKNAPSLSPGGFRENILWDHPSTWNICE